jgi:hypothetical protein
MIIFLLWHSRRRLMVIVTLGVSFAIGLAPYLYLLSAAPAKSATTGGFITANLEKFIELLTSPQQLLVGVLLTAANLGYQFLLLTFVGLWGTWLLFKQDPSFALMLLLIYLGDVAFVLIPTDPPVMMHWHLYHPAYLAFAYPLGFGARDLLRQWGDAPARQLTWAAAIGVPVLLVYFFLAPGVARAMNLTERLGVRDFPGRDTVTYLFTPSKAGDFGPRRYGEAALDSLPQGAVLFADWTPYAVLWYLQAVEGRRRDVRLLELPSSGTLLLAIDREIAAGNLVYLADDSRYYSPDELATRYDIAAAGPVYQVVQRP